MNRPCGPCHACCLTLAIPETGKALWEPCAFCRPDVADPHAWCAVYAARPRTCRAFFCLWATAPTSGIWIPEDCRPDRVGLLLTVVHDLPADPGIIGPVVYGLPLRDGIVATEIVPGAANLPTGRRLLLSLVDGHAVFLASRAHGLVPLLKGDLL
jgi:hypothetical protein